MKTPPEKMIPVTIDQYLASVQKMYDQYVLAGVHHAEYIYNDCAIERANERFNKMIPADTEVVVQFERSFLRSGGRSTYIYSLSGVALIPLEKRLNND